MEQKDLTVKKACELSKMPRSSFYAGLKPKNCQRNLEDMDLKKLIVNTFEESRRTYGKRRIQAYLKTQGKSISLERISRLMTDSGLIAANKTHLKRKPKLALPETDISLDLVNRNFNPTKPDEVWVTDISYIATLQGWLFLAVVIDLFSRRVVGWKACDHQRSELVTHALQSAMARRPLAKGVILHSDRGTQYRSKAYTEFSANAGFKSSMGAAKTCYDNAVCESFFGTYKNEDLYRRAKASFEETQFTIFTYIEGFYNTKRLHSKLGYLSPVDYEKQQRVVV
jgi:putative transposase